MSAVPATKLSAVIASTRWFRRGIACLLLLALHSPAFAVTFASQPDPAEESTLRLISRLPRSVETVVVLRDGAELIRVVDGSPLWTVLGQTGLLAQTTASWSTLAKRLGWSGSEALDRLLGGACVLATAPGSAVGAGGDAPLLSPPPWVLIGSVSPETEARLRERLEAMPRDLVAGQPILSIENGKFVLAVVRWPHTPLPNAAEPIRPFRVVLSAADETSVGLLRSVVGVLGPESKQQRPAPAMLEGTKAVHDLQAARLPPIVMLARSSDRTPPATWDDGFSVTEFTHSSAAYTVRFTLHDSSLRELLAAVPRTTDALFRIAPGDATFALAQHVLIPPAGAAQPWLTFPLIDGDLRRSLGPAIGPRRLIYAVPAAGAAPENASPLYSITAAMEASADEQLAVGADGFMAEAVKWLDRQSGSENSAPVLFGGAAPDALRTVQLKFDARSRPAALVGTDPALRWRLPTAAAPGRKSWWVASLDPHGAKPTHLAALCERLSNVPATDASPLARRWIAQGVLRPGVLLALVPLPEPWTRPLDPIESITWSMWAAGDTSVQGEFVVGFSQPKSPR